jgi:predicted DCC family thiol-disulfide oxidoreductase YuxK
MIGTYLIFYDAQCPICQRSRQLLERLAPATEMRFIDINDARQMAAYPQIDPQAGRGQMHVLDPAGRLIGGFDALVALTPIIPLLAWAQPLLGVAPIRALGQKMYRWLAANRYRLGGQSSCRSGVCELSH